MNNALLSSYTLWKREIVRFYRDRSRVVGGLVPPVIFWFFIGSGLSSSFSGGHGTELTFLQYFFPGTLVLIFLFSAIFSCMSIIEDRREGFLQSVLVAPVPRISIVMGKIFGSATLSFIQGLPFLALAPLVGLGISADTFIFAILILFGVAFALSGLGFIIAWLLDSTQGFHAIMNMFLIPMWLLSGALFPMHGTPGWLGWLIMMNPLTYCVSAMQRIMFPPEAIGGLPPMFNSVIVIIGYCLATFSIAVFVTRRKVAL